MTKVYIMYVMCSCLGPWIQGSRPKFRATSCPAHPGGGSLPLNGDGFKLKAIRWLRLEEEDDKKNALGFMDCTEELSSSMAIVDNENM